MTTRRGQDIKDGVLLAFYIALLLAVLLVWLLLVCKRVPG